MQKEGKSNIFKYFYTENLAEGRGIHIRHYSNSGDLTTVLIFEDGSKDELLRCMCGIYSKSKMIEGFTGDFNKRCFSCSLLNKDCFELKKLDYDKERYKKLFEDGLVSILNLDNPEIIGNLGLSFSPYDK